ncbi:hypothetical protein KUA11_17405, partial [Acetobacter estunensis]|nr:hypothetical protein [Acetobacter estunensis]
PFAFGSLLGLTIGAAAASSSYESGDYYQGSGTTAQPYGDYSQGYTQPMPASGYTSYPTYSSYPTNAMPQQNA